MRRAAQQSAGADGQEILAAMIGLSAAAQLSRYAVFACEINLQPAVH